MSKQYITGIRAAAIQYRKAIEDLRDEGTFDNDFSFNHFPRACCGDASDLLGQFFLDEGIQMWYVCGTYLEMLASGEISHSGGEIDQLQTKKKSHYLNHSFPFYHIIEKYLK